MYDFTDQVAVVTGAIGNLGSVVSREFQSTNAKLALVDRGENRLLQAFPELADSSDYLLVNCADLMDEHAVENSVNEIIEHFGRVDILVNTVGGYIAGSPVHQTPLDTWDKMTNLNARSIFIACRAIIPHMLKNSFGKIVNISGRPGLKGKAGMASYSASKSAAIRLTESMADELKTHNINVNCVIPGTIDTPENRQEFPNEDFNRWVSPKSLADVILFLSSSASRDIHGATVPVYGKS